MAVALGGDDVQPAVVVQVGQREPQAVVVDDAVVLHADALWVGGVEAVRSAPENEHVRVEVACDDQIEVAVVVEVADAATVRTPGWKHDTGLLGEAVSTCQVDEGAGTAALAVVGAVGQHQVHQPVVVQVAADGLHGPHAAHLLAALRREAVWARRSRWSG